MNERKGSFGLDKLYWHLFDDGITSKSNHIFSERTKVLAELKNKILPINRMNVCVLHGPPKCGKTSLALNLELDGYIKI